MKKKVFLAISILIVIVCMVLISFTQANNSGKCAIEIIDDGANNVSVDENTSLTKKIIESDKTSALYQVQLNNKLQKESVEMALVLDTSKSMGVNDFDRVLYETASQFVGNIFNGVDNIKISVSDTISVKNSMVNKDKVDNLKTAIANLSTENSNSIDQGIDVAKTTFSNSAQKKVLVIFTDATDKITRVAELEQQGIEVITILTDMTRESYVVDGKSTVGLTYMMDSVDTDYIISILNKTMKNVVVTDVFNEDIINYFNFEVIQKAENDIVEEVDNGYIWKIDQVVASSFAELQFKLTLKDNIEIPEEKIYQNIQTSDKLTVKYAMNMTDKIYEVTDSPVIMICEKYNVEIQAVSADNTILPIEGIQFEVTGKNDKGNTIYSDVLTTDKDGIINIEELKTINVVTFNVKPIVNVSGYMDTDSETIIINNDISRKELIVNSNLENKVDNENRNIKFKYPINTKKFTLDVNLTEENNKLVKIQGTEFRLIQPSLDNKYEFSALYGETNNNGKLTFTPVVMPKKGTYDYILSQTTEHEGYESMGNVTIRITFDDNGDMTDIVAKYNKNVTAEKINASYGIINVENKNLLTDVFNFELNLRDKDSTFPLQGGLYTIVAKTEEGEPITYSNQKTDINGKINLVLQGSGFIQLKIKEELPVLGYKADLEEKEIIIYRSEGVVQYVVKTTPIGLDAIADTANNKLIVNLQSESENDLSAIQIKLTDAQEYDVYIQDVTFTLTSIEEPVEKYTGTTDENGIINFVIQGRTQGVYAYKLEIDNSTIPNIYKPIEEEMAVSVTFDENRRLIDISDAKGTFIDFETEVIENEENQKIYHTGIAQVGLEMSDEATTNFEIRLTDNITNEPIVGAGYNVSIKAGDIVRNKKGAKTNSQGVVSTRIINADVVEIELYQISSSIGYAIDSQVQTIKLQRVNDEYKIVEQGPYDLSDLQNGAIFEENKLVFKHVNRRKNGSDIKLNLYINKMDKEENLIPSIPVRIHAPEIRNENGLPLDIIQYTDDFGYLELEKLIVPEIDIPGEEAYTLFITEVEKPVDSDEFVDKANTLIELKLTFRYNENKEIVELTNAEATKGNRLIKDRTFNGYESDESYESNLFLDIYTNYDEFGNFAMDFIKKDTFGKILNGAKYDVTIMRPNGTNLIRNDLEIDDRVEFEGVFVTKGTTIEITEKEAPVGYELNQHTTIIKIVDVDVDTLEVAAEIIDGNSGDTATVIEGVELIPLEDGTIKSAITVSLVDKELNNFKMGIINTDAVTGNGVRDVKYKVVSAKGFQVETPISNGSGKSDFKIGGRFIDETVTYEFTQLQTGEFYKNIKDKITLNVVFDENGEVDNEATLAAQIDPNYGIIWEIDSINVKDGNAVNIKIKNQPQDPLIVNVETLDIVSLNKIENISYRISPSHNIPGEGVETIEVGYVAPNKTKNYTISQITELDTHITSLQQSINVVYDRDGNIATEPRVSDGLELISYSGKTVNVRIKLEPKAPIVLENVSYFDEIALPKAQFEISLNKEKQTITTKTDGTDSILIGKLGTSEEIVYHVSQIKAPIGFAYIDDFDIKVHYNENRVIDNVSLVKENRFVEVSYKVPSTDTDLGYNGNDKGIVKIKVKSYPELKMNIENIDALHGTKLAGTTYQVVSTINTRDNEVVTEADGIGVAHLDKTAINDVVEYTITEIRPSALYQTMKEEVKIQVAFDDDGFIKTCEVVKGNAFATVSKIENITTPEENFILNVQIRSNKMLKINILATDSQDDTYILQNAEFKGTAILKEEVVSSDKVITDVNGVAMLKFDRCLESETIIYTIEQSKKNPGYKFPEENMQLEVTYDGNGKIIPDSVRLLQGSKYIQILNIDDQNFNIDVKIVNEETDEFGVDITVVDKYDDTIKLENIKYEAYLMTDKYAKDENYTGQATTDENGNAYIQFNKYDAEYRETRLLRLIETNVPDTHRTIRAKILVNVEFDENGIIVGTRVGGGYNSYIGWIADGRFVTATHTRHTVILKIHHYPYLNVSVSTEDMYTGENLDAKYKISTTKGPGGYYSKANIKVMEEKIEAVRQKVFQENKGIATLEDLISYLSVDRNVTKIKRSQDNATIDVTINESSVYTVDGNLQIIASRGPWVSSGGMTGYTNIDYIGNGLGEFLEAEFNTKIDEKYDVKKIGPTEQNTSRTFYIYELQEPNQKMQYQKYRPRYYTWYYSIIIGSVTVKYDSKGNIESWTIGNLNSRNNIDYDFIEVNKLDNRNLEVKVKYAPTTTMEVTAIDTVSKEPLSNVRVFPYQNATYNSRQSYEYRTISYYTTDINGKTNYTYWGANINEGQNEYKIDTSVMFSNGYYGTGLIHIKVSYDEDGRIAAADVMSVDENGMPNAEVVGFENNKLKINILYYRKFNIIINKKDIHDNNIKLSAQFKISTNEKDAKTINSSSLSLIGIVKPGETVKYTLSETVVPDKYIPIENLEFYVTFNKDGSVRRAWSDSKLFESVYEREEVAKINPQNVKDLEINIKNEPQVSFKISAVDKFYNEKRLGGVLFTIENDKGDVVTGNPATDMNGIVNAIIGKVYPKETVIYTVKQLSQVNGYVEKNIVIKLQVSFNQNGKLEDYKVISGNEFVSIDNNKFKNGRHIDLTVMLTPTDIKLGLRNYNDITNEVIPNVTYKVISQEIEGGSSFEEKEIVTNADGTVIDVIDKFKKSQTPRVVNYTISEINIPNTYRKIQDIVLQIRYAEDGRIISSNVLSNPSEVIVKVALGGRLQYLNGIDVHILLEIPNNNSYDLVIMNEDKNYKNLGISGTLYDITINGEVISRQTNSDGIIKILNRMDSGNIQIRIAENTIGLGYKADNNNDTILDISKGTEEYSLVLNSNSNSTYADVTVSEEYGVITVIFRNETKSSITLLKDVNEVRYNVTAKEKLSDGTYTNEIVLGNDLSDVIAQEKLHYDLGVTPQNKTIVYSFEEVSIPGDYHSIGTIEVIVEYDMFGHINRISDNSDRVDVIEDPAGSHDIVVIVSEYETPASQLGEGEGTITLVKDNKEVRYEIYSKEMDEQGKYSNERVVGSDAQSIVSEEQLFYELTNLPKNKTMIFTIKEVSTPDGYASNGIIEVTAKFNEDGLIYEITDNCENAEAKLIPRGRNDIAVVIGEEAGSLAVFKDNKNVQYIISSKEDNGDGTYSNDRILREETDETVRDPIYLSFREETINKTVIYTFKERFVPEGYSEKETFDIKVKYDSEGKIESIVNNYEYLIVEEDPIGSNDIFVYVLSDEEIKARREAYTIKVISQEVDTNLRINDSIFDIEINKGEGNLIDQALGSATGNIEKKGYILEKGVIKFGEIKDDGYITVEVNQRQLADGYIYGKQKTSGTVALAVEYQDVSGDIIKVPVLSVIENDGLEVSVDNTNKEVIIKVYNEPEVIMEILSRFEKKNADGSRELLPQEEVHYTITAQIQTSTEIIDTDLNVTAKETDEFGKTKTSVGRSYAGKSVIYTIRQEENTSYDTVGDILILVQYDTKGLIKYYEVLTALDYVEIVGNKGERVISLEITNRKQKYSDFYKIKLEKHHIDDEEYGKLISGVKFNIHVKEEYGEEVEWDAITDADGLIISKEFTGYGRIQIDITELEVTPGFELDSKTYTIRVNRDQKTGELSIESSDKVSYEFGENYEEIIAKPVNEPRANSHTIVINKTDLNLNTLITSSEAEFDVTRIEYENHGTEEEPNIVEIPINLGKIVTDKRGKARLENLDSPTVPGVYKYIIKEIKAPEGYIISEEEIVVNIAFKQNEDGEMIIDKELTEILAENAKAISVKDNLLNIAVYNISEDSVIGEDEYSLDITKVDYQTGQPIEEMAIFKVWLPDENNTSVYTETMETSLGKGKLDYCYIEQDKDYKIRLTHMKLPKEDTVLKYVFREINPPVGYEKIEEDLELSIQFKTDEATGKMYIASVTSSNPDYLKINTITPCSTDTRLDIQILNDEERQKEFTIKYDANDNGEGTVVPEPQIKLEGINIILNPIKPEREGYKFNGWSAIPTATVGEYQPGDIYYLDGDITLYAIWENTLYLKSTEYLIGTGDNPAGTWSPGDLSEYEEGDLYIKGIRPQAGIRIYANQVPSNEGTKLNEFLSNLDTNADEIKVYIPQKDSNGNVILREENLVTDDQLVATAMIIKLTKGTQEIQLTLIVRGDVLNTGSTVGDGKVTNVEAARLKKLSGTTLIKDYTIEEQQAIDFDVNTTNRWSTNKQKIISAYQKHKLEPIR